MFTNKKSFSRASRLLVTLLIFSFVLSFDPAAVFAETPALPPGVETPDTEAIPPKVQVKYSIKFVSKDGTQLLSPITKLDFSGTEVTESSIAILEYVPQETSITKTLSTEEH
ncbi:MAG: hypothetical protein Q4D77_02910 [Peptostreptococcaceae bacterium]|nr:hypothetical protein [Peptostreptococcaceae bacterium]